MTTRAAAIITDDSLLDATFVKNLIVGSAQIGYAVIMDGHIVNVSADKIHAGTITLHQQLKLETSDKSIVIDDSGIKATHGGQLHLESAQMASITSVAKSIWSEATS